MQAIYLQPSLVPALRVNKNGNDFPTVKRTSPFAMKLHSGWCSFPSLHSTLKAIASAGLAESVLLIQPVISELGFLRKIPNLPKALSKTFHGQQCLTATWLDLISMPL